MILPQEVCTYRVMMYLIERDGRWISYADMAEYIGFDLESCKKAMKVLEADGYAIHRPMVDDDGRPNGSGWFETGKHRELYKCLDEDQKDSSFLSTLYDKSNTGYSK